MDPADWEGFDWDDGNIGKNWSHRVTDWESEEVFFNSPILFGGDAVHSQKEQRFYVLGQTNRGRGLFIAFTIRRKLVRIISARDMNVRERKVYENAKEDSDIH
jgi:uncharacterized protein